MGPDETRNPGADRPSRNGGDGADPRVGAILELGRASVRLYRRVRHAAGEIHDDAAPPAAPRSVLRELYRSGPKTVPEMARARPVSRQHIQALVNDLLEEGLVETRTNPAHKRSHLIAITDEGRRLVEELQSREREVLRRLQPDLDADRLRDAAEVLERVRMALASDRWRSAVEEAGLAEGDGDGG